jgi:hypothetical protein
VVCVDAGANEPAVGDVQDRQQPLEVSNVTVDQTAGGYAFPLAARTFLSEFSSEPVRKNTSVPVAVI